MTKFNISRFDPCESGLLFYQKYTSFEEAWNACERGDWMLWLASQLKASEQILALAEKF